jgi:hypothetical protein
MCARAVKNQIWTAIAVEITSSHYLPAAH